MQKPDNSIRPDNKDDIATLQHQFVAYRHRFMNKPLLTTETPHPKTYNLSHLAKTDPTAAVAQLISCDIATCKALLDFQEDLNNLALNIKNTLSNGGTIYIVGCGASGRVAVLLEKLSHDIRPLSLKGKIKGLIAGGDAALVKSIEQIEDDDSHAKSQLLAYGLTKNDLVIGLSASGETPFVISSLAFAKNYCKSRPWFVYHNPTSQLKTRGNVNQILTDPTVNHLALDVGEMALTGSTRMQAATASLLSLGLALFYPSEINTKIKALMTLLTDCDFSALSPLIIKEAHYFKQKIQVVYETTSQFGLNVLTDTTERAPTFNIPPFQNQLDKPTRPPPYQLFIPEGKNSKDTWHKLLNRDPVALNWQHYPQTKAAYIHGFDFSNDAHKNCQHFKIAYHNSELQLSFCNQTAKLTTLNDELLDQVFLKIVLNIHSTLIMGRCNFYAGNIMNSLCPANLKLIDRAIRYTQATFNLKYNTLPSYQTAQNAVFACMPSLLAQHSIVNQSVLWLLNHLGNILQTGK